jgi:hypothetical protein
MSTCSHKRLGLLFRFIYLPALHYLFLSTRHLEHQKSSGGLVLFDSDATLPLLIRHQHLQCFCVAITTCQSRKATEIYEWNGMMSAKLEWTDGH